MELLDVLLILGSFSNFERILDEYLKHPFSMEIHYRDKVELFALLQLE